MFQILTIHFVPHHYYVDVTLLLFPPLFDQSYHYSNNLMSFTLFLLLRSMIYVKVGYECQFIGTSIRNLHFCYFYRCKLVKVNSNRTYLILLANLVQQLNLTNLPQFLLQLLFHRYHNQGLH